MKKIVITGAAGLVGQNLISQLVKDTNIEVTAIDKHKANLAILHRRHPQLRIFNYDLSQQGAWLDEFKNCTHLVNAHAQIGGNSADDYERNNVTATENVVTAARQCGVKYVVNISSSVVNSATVDNYTESKKAQESIVLSSGIKQVVLRPTLMFGWFDRKHIGWLARFMKQVPIFPVPGDGKYLRQPLYAGDFCNIIHSALENEITGMYNITGLESLYYIDLIRMLKEVIGSQARILKIPYRLFWGLLKVNAAFDSNPAFTCKQLEALVTPDVFEVIDWPGIFTVEPTPLHHALMTTFHDEQHSGIALEF
jgi:nucleoside-diphosphate-sugar epimerase